MGRQRHPAGADWGLRGGKRGSSHGSVKTSRSSSSRQVDDGSAVVFAWLKKRVPDPAEELVS